MFLANNYKSIICLNGLFEKIPINAEIIIAADGAFNQLISRNIIPQVVIGDFDSLITARHPKARFIQHFDQNLCDFEKCLLYAESNQLFPSMIVGGYGLELDHCFNNMAIFAKYSQKLNLTFFANNSYAKMVKNKIVFSARKGEIISILPYPSAIVSSEGLKWELSETQLDIIGKSSARNQACNDTIQINVIRGTALVVCPQDFPA